jgi:hypothetical protein
MTQDDNNNKPRALATNDKHASTEISQPIKRSHGLQQRRENFKHSIFLMKTGSTELKAH